MEFISTTNCAVRKTWPNGIEMSVTVSGNGVEEAFDSMRDTSEMLPVHFQILSLAFTAENGKVRSGGPGLCLPDPARFAKANANRRGLHIQCIFNRANESDCQSAV